MSSDNAPSRHNHSMGRWLWVSDLLFFLLITGALGWIGYGIFSMVKLRSTHTEAEWLKTNIKSQPHPLEPVTDAVKDKPQTLSEMPSILPILVSPEGETKSYKFSSGFGYRTHPTTKRRQFHFGLDISTSAATPVIATADGVIAQVETDAFWGQRSAGGCRFIISPTR
ncbi:M23 family metallopeptidase [Candidatus Poribacteria bacterium]|nr:M23 family metallopeptidase [Candidatus Poribacteria bacterium]